MIEENYKVGLQQIVREIRVTESHCAECAQLYIWKRVHISLWETQLRYVLTKSLNQVCDHFQFSLK